MGEARDHCGRGSAGWRWLDIAALASSQLIGRKGWKRATITRIVYCTALRDKDTDKTSREDQETYIRALETDSRVHVEYGQYNPRFGRGVLSKPIAGGKRRRHERIISPGPANFPSWMPVGEVRGADGNMHISIHYASYEEKGSDVNLASYLLADVLSKKVDAAIVLSNDGDLRYPLQFARDRVPVGLINPSRSPTSQMLKGSAGQGVGSHWWQRLVHTDFRNNQLPDSVNGVTKPKGW